jgi:hypothetical protein
MRASRALSSQGHHKPRSSEYNLMPLMFGKSIQRKLMICFIATIALHGYVLVKAWRGVREGMPDFTIFYTAGQILNSGEGHALYDEQLQKNVQAKIVPVALNSRRSILPYNHPAFEAIIFAPLTRLSYLTAYLIWVGINLGILFSIPLFLRKELPFLGQASMTLWILAMLAFFPIFMTLLQGQDSVVLLACYCSAYFYFRRQKNFSAGVWLGLGLFKFHLVLPFLISLFFTGRKRIAEGFSSAAAILICVGVAVCGWRSFVNYPLFVWRADHNPGYLGMGGSKGEVDLRGLVDVLPLNGKRLVLSVVVIMASVAILSAACVSWRRRRRNDMNLPFSMSLLAAVLVSYHSHIYDWSILFLAIVLAIEFVMSSKRVTAAMRAMIMSMIALLYLTPLYLALILRFDNLELMTIVLLCLFIFLAVECFVDSSQTSLSHSEKV